MLQTKICTNVYYSDADIQIDFCVVFEPYTNLEEAEKIIQKAYDSWWKLSEPQFEILPDYISRYLTENNVEHKIYFKNDEGEVG